MTSLPLILDEEPLGIILRAGREIARPAKIWAYCWFADNAEGDDHVLAEKNFGGKYSNRKVTKMTKVPKVN